MAIWARIRVFLGKVVPFRHFGPSIPIEGGDAGVPRALVLADALLHAWHLLLSAVTLGTIARLRAGDAAIEVATPRRHAALAVNLASNAAMLAAGPLLLHAYGRLRPAWLALAPACCLVQALGAASAFHDDDAVAGFSRDDFDRLRPFADRAHLLATLHAVAVWAPDLFAWAVQLYLWLCVLSSLMITKVALADEEEEVGTPRRHHHMMNEPGDKETRRRKKGASHKVSKHRFHKNVSGRKFHHRRRN